MRIAFARIAQETNAFSPVRTTLDDFRRVHWHEGADLLARCGSRGVEAPGFLRNAELSGFVRAVREAGHEPVPLLSAWAVPGGPLSAGTLAGLRDALVTALRDAGPVDGLYLSMHGAMAADGSDDAEGDLLAAAREVVGGARIAVSFDLHAQLTPAKVRSVDLLTAYRTNPHRDHDRVGYRTGRLLAGAVSRRYDPTIAWRTLPMVMGGGTNIDLFPTMRPLFRRMAAMEEDSRVLYASLFMCHLWHASPDLGWATCVVTDGDQQLAERLADELAERCWSVRAIPPPRFPDAEEAIGQVRRAWLRRRLGTACVCDASDIVGAGATGESTHLLRALVEHGSDLHAYAPVRDAAVVAHLWDRNVGEPVVVEVGGKLDPAVHGEPLTVRGRLLRKEATAAFGRVVVLEAGNLRLVVTEAAPLAMKPSFYADLGLSPWRADLVVVKSMFPFRLYFLPQNRLTVYARTRGITDLDAGLGQPFRDPVHPIAPVADWRPTDRRRRGLPAEDAR